MDQSQDKEASDPHLGANVSDRVAALARSIVGATPFVGSALAEIITEIVPNQRIDRLEQYLLLLQGEITKLKIENADERVKRPECVDLIEDGAYQAVRALSDERKQYIARCVAEGIASDEAEQIREKRVLNLLAQLDDEEILILNAYGSRSQDMGDSFAKLRPQPATLGASKEVIEKDALYKAAIDKLERLSLLQQRITLNREAEKKLGLKMPEFDTFSGRPKGSRDITFLGSLVLEKIGLQPARQY